MDAVTPYGITPDGARVIFLAERGPTGSVTHTGDRDYLAQVTVQPGMYTVYDWR